MSVRRIAFVVIGMIAWLLYLKYEHSVNITNFSQPWSVFAATEHYWPTLWVFLSLTGVAFFFVRKD
tara:strand:+ start:326 stop:523 length:198 start_codon:yes stop_codon:yes gene_type:complete